MITEAIVRKALEGVMDPELNRSLIELGMIRDVQIQEDQVEVTVALTTPACPLKDKIAADVRAAVGALDGVGAVQVALT